MGEKNSLSTNGAGKAEYPSEKKKKNEVGPFLTPHEFHRHMNSKWIEDLNVTSETIQLLEKNRGVNPHDLKLRQGFSDMAPKVQAAIEIKDKLDFIKIENTYAANDSIKEVKVRAIEW